MGKLLLPGTVFVAVAVRGEVALLLALVERKTNSEPLHRMCGSFGQLAIVGTTPLYSVA